MLAPEEVFDPASASDLKSRNELTPAEKKAMHNKQKKAKRKMRDMLEKSIDKLAKTKRPKTVKAQKEEALKSAVKSGKGVTVIGKEGKELKSERAKR